jgi:hypothetical protein
MTIDVKAIIAKHRGLTGAKEVSHSHALNKIKNGEWESVNDLTPGRHNEFIDHTKNHKPRFTAYVKVAPSPRPPLARHRSVAEIKRINKMANGNALLKVQAEETIDEQTLDEKADMEHHDPAHHLMKYRGHMAIADAYYDMGDKDSAEAHMAKADLHARKHFHITGTHPERE